MKKLHFFSVLFTTISVLFLLSCHREDPPYIPGEGVKTKKPPSANAGPDQATILPKDSIVLDGSASMDPDGIISKYEWSKSSGPGSYEFVDSISARTLVKNLVEGTYEFKLTVTDTDGLSDRNITRVFVKPPSTPLPDCNGSYSPFNVSMMEIGTLSDPRSPSVAAAGSKIVFAGGANRVEDDCQTWCNTLPSAAIDIYDVNTRAWSVAQLSQPRQGIGALGCGNKIFLAGGSNYELWFNNGIVYNNVDIYDASTNTWTIAFLSQARTCVTAASLGNKVLFAGGTENGGDGTTRVDIYDINSNTWSTAELSAPRYAMDVVVDGSKIYFVGGEDWQDVYSNIDIYDVSTNSWSTSELEQPYYAITDVMVGNTNYWIYYLGNNQVKIKNMSTGAITEGCASYSYNGTFSINNDIVFPSYNMGGYLGRIFNTETGQWSVGLLNPALPLSAPMVTANNTLYLGGGTLGNYGSYVYTNRVYALNW
jgi:hypothetical protein